MNEFFSKLMVSTGNVLYSMIGPALSSTIANSYLGKLIFRMLDGGGGELKIYEVDGIKLKLFPEEARTLGICYLGALNPLETRFLKQILKPGDVFIDVGTYVDAWFTLLASKLVGNKGKVYAFEPVPDFYRRLKTNIKTNGIKNVICEKSALSDKKAMRSFYQTDGTSSFFESHTKDFSSLPAKLIKVETITLSQYIKKVGIKKVNLVKIDVEGAEMEVLRGAKDVLSKTGAPDLMIEVVDLFLSRSGSSKKELLDFLYNLGYKAYIFTKDGLQKYEDSYNQTELFNLFFTKRSIKPIGG